MDYLLSAHKKIHSLSDSVGSALLKKQWQVATAESCTGGGIAAAITQVPGSSAWFEYGIVSYANRAKKQLLHVQDKTLAGDGAVSEAVVMEMARGVLALSNADIAIAVSGIAGPAGGSVERPVGTVWFAWALATGEVHTQLVHFSGERIHIQLQAVEQGLEGLLKIINQGFNRT